MSTRTFKIKPGQWQQLPEVVVSVTNTSSSGTQVAVSADGQTKALKPNECARLLRPSVAYVMTQAGHGQVTYEAAD